jgi:hypothetical protein
VHRSRSVRRDQVVAPVEQRFKRLQYKLLVLLGRIGAHAILRLVGLYRIDAMDGHRKKGNG